MIALITFEARSLPKTYPFHVVTVFLCSIIARFKKASYTKTADIQHNSVQKPPNRVPHPTRNSSIVLSDEAASFTMNNTRDLIRRGTGLYNEENKEKAVETSSRYTRQAVPEYQLAFSLRAQMYHALEANL
uniref:AlNc14C137G7143 protein n=1 Tax=Albugo laibachii Nc14 TaxID=890382 RepID=F0WKV4_9STRA|nr:AlNc14C137G7143 [Albugo laibachii Nc14]|eukprot:CCA21911.1 AlNc14C137G7143 [Albugo laibachii Nc14]